MKRVAFVLLMAVPVWVSAFQVELITPKTDCRNGESISIEIQVFPANPGETALSVESVPEGFSLAGSRKELRSREDDSPFSEGRVDSVVFIQEWKALRAGSWRLCPFVIQVNGQEPVLAPVDLLVHGQEVAGTGELRWSFDRSDTVIRTGMPVPLTLEARRIHEIVSLYAPLPRNALLEKTGETFGYEAYSGAEWRPIASFVWTPLSDVNLTLPFAELEYRDRSGESFRTESNMRLVPVAAADLAETVPAESPLVAEAFTRSLSRTSEDKGGSTDYPLPESLRNPRLPVLVRAAELWRQKRYAASLVCLRQLEQESLFPANSRTIRLEAEKILGITETLPVSSKTGLRFALLFCILFTASTIVLTVVRYRSRRISRIWIVSCGITVVLIVVVMVLLVPATRHYAVSSGGPLRQIPEQTAGIVSSIPEGTPVIVLKQTGTWYFVRLPAALEGWISHDELISYTGTGLYGLW